MFEADVCGMEEVLENPNWGDFCYPPVQGALRTGISILEVLCC